MMTWCVTAADSLENPKHFKTGLNKEAYDYLLGVDNARLFFFFFFTIVLLSWYLWGKPSTVLIGQTFLVNTNSTLPESYNPKSLFTWTVMKENVETFMVKI